MIATTDVNEFKPEFTKKRAFRGMVLLLPVAESTIKIAPERFLPAVCERARIIRCQPLKRGVVTFSHPRQ